MYPPHAVLRHLACSTVRGSQKSGPRSEQTSRRSTMRALMATTAVLLVACTELAPPNEQGAGDDNVPISTDATDVTVEPLTIVVGNTAVVANTTTTCGA